MTRVLNIISDTNIGGAGRVILNYLRYADKTKFETLVAVPKGSLLIDPLKEAGVTPIEVDGIADRSFDKQDVKTLRALIQEVKPDLVHTHGALSGRIAAKWCHVPVVYSRHSAFPVPKKLKYPPGKWINGLINGFFADHIIAVSPATRDNLTEAGISPKKITVVMNGVAPIPPTTREEQVKLREELELPDNATIFGILARIEDYKGHLTLIHAAKLLKERGYADFRVLIAGTGDFEEEVSRCVVEMGVGDVVKMLGFRSDVGALLNILDVQVNASYGTEATSMALLEGMSLGLASVVSDYGGNPYVIENGKTGLLFPSKNSLDLSKAMGRLMDDPSLRRRLGRRAKEDFEERFTGKVFARNIEKIYGDVLKGAK
jgi:glycosyltransferase involved in cell wall biosynthesis